MRIIFAAASLLTYLAVIAGPAQAARTWQGISVGVLNEETSALDYYTVRFTLDDSAPAAVTSLTAQDPEHTPFTRAMYENITAMSVTGPDGTMKLTGGLSFVSTLAPALAHFGTIPFLMLGGTDGGTPGYQMQFSYTPASGYGDTSMPTSLDVGAPGAEVSFSLLNYYWDGDPADGTIGGPDELLNFRFASGGFLAATAVPEPATWAMMITGFGLVGSALRRRNRKVGLADA